MGGRGRLGGLADRRDRASDRRRELVDLTYEGSVRVLRQALAPCSRNLCTAVPIAAERVGATRADQYGCTRKERARATIRVAVRGSERVGVNRYRKKTLFLRNSARTGSPPTAALSLSRFSLYVFVETNHKIHTAVGFLP